MKTFTQWLKHVESKPAVGFRYNTEGDMYRVSLMRQSMTMLMVNDLFNSIPFEARNGKIRPL